MWPGRVPQGMLLHRTLAALVALAPGLLFAQPGFSPEEAARLAFLGFDARMRALPLAQQAPAPLQEYVLVYTVHSNGGEPFILRGDTATLANFLAAQEPDHAFHLEGAPYGPVYYGDRYAFFGMDLPTGLPRYTHWYFERR